MDSLLKEFLLFFGLWPLVIFFTIVIGVRLGTLMSRSVSALQLKPAAIRSAETTRQRL